jgi:hypothetical protein
MGDHVLGSSWETFAGLRGCGDVLRPQTGGEGPPRQRGRAGRRAAHTEARNPATPQPDH